MAWEGSRVKTYFAHRKWAKPPYGLGASIPSCHSRTGSLKLIRTACELRVRLEQMEVVTELYSSGKREGKREWEKNEPVNQCFDINKIVGCLERQQKR